MSSMNANVIHSPKIIKNSATPKIFHSAVKGVTQHIFRTVLDDRGNLSVGEFEREIPFIPKRYFLVFDVSAEERRGEHAHLQCQQFLIAVKGSIHGVVDDGYNREEIILDQPNKGLYMPPMTWGTQYGYSSDAVLLVFSSEYYDPNDYVRDYEDFLKLIKAKNNDE